MRNIWIIMRRELAGYFATPVAYVFIVIFLALLGALTFYVGNFFERGQADLIPFFTFHPWIYLLLIPAISMRLWAEERRTGTVELLLTLPVTITQAVVGKWLAAWVFTAIALVFTAPFWATINVLGKPDNGVVLAGYVGSLLVAGGYLAVGGAVSALTKNQVIAFVVAAAMCFVFTVSGAPVVTEFLVRWAPEAVVEQVKAFSFITRFNGIMRGVIDARDLVYFASFIAFWLFANAVIVDLKKAG